MCPPRRRASDPTTQYTNRAAYRFPNGTARKRPTRRMHSETSRCARRPWRGDAHMNRVLE
eukprot:3320701-Pyramimonas_sp.AAC.1